MPAVAPLPTPSPAITRPYQPHGAALTLARCRANEVILDGPAGTGKSRACLEKLFAIATKYAGCRILIVRKTRESLTEAALVTWEEKVVPEGHPCLTNIQRRNRQAYTFPNGSVVNVGGLDKPTKIMSTEYDVIYVQEAIELSEGDWEALTTRLRNGVVPYQQMIGDTNPDAPTHWIKQRANSGSLLLIPSRHEDNPTIWDAIKKAATEFGRIYLERLDALTGVRKDRLRWGKWVAAEGLVYEGFDVSIHLINKADLPAGWQKWRRVWGIDFGYTNPFVWQEWLIDPDDRLYLYREIYHTQRLTEDLAAQILQLVGWKMQIGLDGRKTGKLIPARENPDPLPEDVICDHDIEDRKTFERHTGLSTKGAYKAVSAGIQAVAARLKPVPENHPSAKPRLMICRDALVERDEERAKNKLPCCTEEEIFEYVWDTKDGKKKGEEPVKNHDHGMDDMRYVVAHVDNIRTAKAKVRFRPA